MEHCSLIKTVYTRKEEIHFDNRKHKEKTALIAKCMQKLHDVIAAVKKSTLILTNLLPWDNDFTANII